jgi:hypothetical protein
MTKRGTKNPPAKRGPTLAAPAITRKLDLACGQSPAEGFEGVDIYPKAQHVVDLMTYPWPFEDNSVAELRCSHFVEHIPMIFVDDEGREVPMGWGHTLPSGSVVCGKDALFKFFDECYRILVPDGWMEVIVPSARSNRAFQDPTHRRFIVEHTFAYLDAEWRRGNRLDHYNVDCDFVANVNWTIGDPTLNVRAPEVQQLHFNHYWNTTMDFVAKMKCRKPASTRDPNAGPAVIVGKP